MQKYCHLSDYVIMTAIIYLAKSRCVILTIKVTIVTSVRAESRTDIEKNKDVLDSARTDI